MTEQEMTSLLFRLADLGIQGVSISYEGSGDSGMIEGVNFTNDPNVTCMEDLEAIYDHGLDNLNHLKDVDADLVKQIEEYAYEALLNDIEDWYNNEGGFGYVLLHIKTGKYKIFNTVRYYQTEDYTHEGSLLEKTKE